MIRKLASGEYRLYSRKRDPKSGRRRNLGTFKTREAAEQHQPCSSSSAVPEHQETRQHALVSHFDVTTFDGRHVHHVDL